MKSALKTKKPILVLIAASTCLPASEAGPTLSNSRNGPKNGKSGPDPVPASHSVRRANEKVQRTKGICGPKCSDLSRSAVLQRFLASRLQARLDVNGSLEYSLTWKAWDMPAREPICALRASARRTSDSGCSGWRTPMNQESGVTIDIGERAYDRKSGRVAQIGLAQEVQMVVGWATPRLAGWATPNLSNRGRERKEDKRPQSGGEDLQTQAQGVISGWPTPNAMKAGATSRSRKRKHELLIGGLVQKCRCLGRNSTSSCAETENRGVLNPAHSRWLQGYLAAWDFCGVTAIASCRK